MRKFTNLDCIGNNTSLMHSVPTRIPIIINNIMVLYYYNVDNQCFIVQVVGKLTVDKRQFLNR